MSKLIEELAINSTIYDCIIDPYDSKRNGDNQSSIMVDLVRFAELIVRECADLFEVEYGPSEVSGNEVARVLKDHFGVEG
jgi:hypothetical protein